MLRDDNALQQFVGRMVGEIGAAFTAPLVVVGDKLGLYRALAAHGPLTPAELAQRTGTFERYVREWLAAQAAAGYVGYEPDSGTFHMTPEQALVFADEDSPIFMAGSFETLASMFIDEPKVTEAFRTGRGVGWHDHHDCLFRGCERFYRASYLGHLVDAWLPALDGVAAKLERGASVADVGCGHGASTIIMARAFPNSRFVGFDSHPASVERARAAAERAGVAGRVRFDGAAAQDYPGTGYDLVTCFDCLHDMGNPAGAARHVRRSLAPDGTWMVVEPFAHDALADNLNPVGRIFYAASTMICTPASLSQEGALGLGAQAGEKRLRAVIEAGGFTRVRRAAETPFSLVLEARP